MKDNISLSIIVPVYNVGNYLEECLTSLVNQTLENIEIIVVNDGSTDNSSEIIKKFEESYNNIIAVYQDNAGLSSARNKGLEFCSGKFIAFVDSDDFVDIDMYKKMHEKAEKYNLDMVIVDLELYWSDSKKYPFNNLEVDESKVYSDREQYNLLLNRQLNCQVMNKIYKRTVWEKSRIKFDEGKYYEDIVPSFKIPSYFKNCMFINESLYKYRMRIGSISSTASDNKIKDFIYATNEAKNIVNLWNCKEKLDLTEDIKCFNLKYGLYALDMLYNCSKINFELEANIKNNFELREPKLNEIFRKKNISMATKVKFILFKVNCLRLYYKIKTVLKK